MFDGNIGRKWTQSLKFGMVLGSVGFFTLISLKACQILVPFKDGIVVEELIIEERKFTNIRYYLSKQNGQTISLGKDTCACSKF